jgi:hypothetical protein
MMNENEVAAGRYTQRPYEVVLLEKSGENEVFENRKRGGERQNRNRAVRVKEFRAMKNTVNMVFLYRKQDPIFVP